jgi:hypothetical protein
MSQWVQCDFIQINPIWADAACGLVRNTGGGGLWAKGRGKLRLRRPLTYSETEELAIRMQAIAAANALEAIPMDRIRDDGSVIGEDPSDEDDLLLQAVVMRILH